METKLVKVAHVRHLRWPNTIIVLIALGVFCTPSCLLLSYLLFRNEAAFSRIYRNDMGLEHGLVVKVAKENEDLRSANASLRNRLDQMTESAGVYRSYRDYENCVMEALGIYRMENVSTAFDQFYPSSEVSARCLAESAWLKSHPFGINPEDLNH
jgi:hypothetical protein